MRRFGIHPLRSTGINLFATAGAVKEPAVFEKAEPTVLWTGTSDAVAEPAVVEKAALAVLSTGASPVRFSGVCPMRRKSDSRAVAQADTAAARGTTAAGDTTAACDTAAGDTATGGAATGGVAAGGDASCAQLDLATRDDGSFAPELPGTAGIGGACTAVGTPCC